MCLTRRLILTLYRAFVPSTPHSYGVSASTTIVAESDRRDKRAKRFDDEKRAFDSQDDYNNAPLGSNYANARASGSGSGSGNSNTNGGLAGRLIGRFSGGASGSNSNGSNYSTPEPEGVYDPVSIILSLSLSYRFLFL